MITQAEAIIETFRELKGNRRIAEIKEFVTDKYGPRWKDFGTIMADMVSEKNGGNATSTVPDYFRVPERIEYGVYSLMNYE